MRITTLLLALLVCSAANGQQDSDLDATFARDVLIIEANAHACYRFDIYLAIGSAQTQRGLMFVRHMPMTTGMLFVYDRDDYYSMWMKNTLIPLDMLFVRSDGQVASVIRNTEPKSLASRGAEEPVRFVLELNAGVTERLSIDAGSRLIWDPQLELE